MIKIILQKDERGAVAILTVVVVSVAALLMAVSASFLGLGDLDLGYTHQKGGEVFSVADGCMEEALEQLRINNAYNGGELNLGAGSCIISIVVSGNERTISVFGTVGAYNKKIEANITLIDDVITINNWKELST